MNKIITEITPLEKKDCFYLVDRNKESFTFPLHKHEEIELNFVENCSGARRIVGDSIEILGQYDLALIGSNLEHVWEQNVCQHQKVREITIQFEPNLFGDTLLGKSQMNSIQQLLENAKNGIAFSLSAISPDTVPKGVEPSFSDRKSDVLPLHQGTIMVGVPDSNW